MPFNEVKEETRKDRMAGAPNTGGTRFLRLGKGYLPADASILDSPEARGGEWQTGCQPYSRV